MTSSEVIEALAMAQGNYAVERRIQAWHEIVLKCEHALSTETDTASQVFNNAILKIARLELEMAVREKMEQ